MATTVIRDASLVDGTGAPQRPADIVINDGRIVEITPALKASTSHASRVINADASSTLCEDANGGAHSPCGTCGTCERGDAKSSAWRGKGRVGTCRARGRLT